MAVSEKKSENIRQSPLMFGESIMRRNRAMIGGLFRLSGSFCHAANCPATAPSMRSFSFLPSVNSRLKTAAYASERLNVLLADNSLPRHRCQDANALADILFPK